MNESAPDTGRIRIVDRVRFRAARGLGFLPPRLQRRLAGSRAPTTDGLDPGIALMLAAREAIGEGDVLSGAPAAELRASARAQANVFARPLTPVASVRRLEVPGGDGPRAARLYAPETSGATPLLVYAHGGGYMIGDLDSHDEACRLLCVHAGLRVLSLDYRLAPEDPYPSGADDVAEALAWAIENAAELGAVPGRVAIGGDSAGGNLSAVACQRLRDLDATLPQLQLLIYPGVDFAGDYESRELFSDGYFLTSNDIDSAAANYLGSDTDPEDPGVSPLRGDLEGLPDAVIVTAGLDPLRDEGTANARRLEQAGSGVVRLEFPALIHGFLNMTNVAPAARDATISIAGALRAAIAFADQA